MSYDYVISLGGACGCAHQIRTYFNQHEAFPFDWLVTPFDSIEPLISAGLRGLGSDLAPYKDTKWFINTRFMTLHPHEMRLVDGELPTGWQHLMRTVRAKHDYLADRWNAVMSSPNRVLLVRHNGRHHLDGPDVARVPVSDANRLVSLIRAAYPTPEIDFLFAASLVKDDPEPLAKGVHRHEVRYTDTQEWPDPANYWHGATKDWTRAFDAVLGSGDSASNADHAVEVV